MAKKGIVNNLLYGKGDNKDFTTANLPSTTGTRVSICSPTVTCTASKPSGTTTPVILVTSDTCAQDATVAATPAAKISELSFIII